MDRGKMNAWLTITARDGTIIFECEHCGTGDYGWDFTARGWFTDGHAGNISDLFFFARRAMDNYPDANIAGYLANDFNKRNEIKKEVK